MAALILLFLQGDPFQLADDALQPGDQWPELLGQLPGFLEDR
jgi:hypothetical protein